MMIKNKKYMQKCTHSILRTYHLCRKFYKLNILYKIDSESGSLTYVRFNILINYTLLTTKYRNLEKYWWETYN